MNPIYARQPLSGRGAEMFGGRFNPKGVPALYTCLSVMTALREANQVGHLQPTTLVSYEGDIQNVFDCRDQAALQAQGVEPAVLADNNWRTAMRSGADAPTQALARRLKAQGHNGLLVRSFARGADDGDLNLVLWRWSDAAPHRLTVIDDEGRLT